MKKTLEILTTSDKETKKIGEILGLQILNYRHRTSIIISLEGELGSGKTTFTQGFAKGLGVKENPRSPTFVIMRIYPITPPNPPHRRGQGEDKERVLYSPLPLEGVRGRLNFVHIDAYRIKSKDLKILGWRELIKNPQNIILVEWGNKIKNILPKNSLKIIFRHIGRSHERLIKVYK